MRIARPSYDAPPEVAARLVRADRMIDLAWGVAALWATLRVVGAIWLWRNTDDDSWAWFVDPAVIVLLAYGIYRRSRACAVALLVYVVVELWRAYHIAERPQGIGAAMILGLSFLMGIRGTYEHRREREEGAAVAERR